MALRALGIGPFGSLARGRPSESARSDSAHRLPHDERRLDARPRRERRGARRAVGIVGVHARAAGADRRGARAHEKRRRTRASTRRSRARSRSAKESRRSSTATSPACPAATSSRSGSCAPTRAVELASFRETGDGPRGLIDAADKLARALRGKAGESLRAVNATPPLVAGDDELARRAAKVQRGGASQRRSATIERWRSRARRSRSTRRLRRRGACSPPRCRNYGGTRSAIDSAVTQAYRYRDRLPALERDMVIGAVLRDWARGATARKAIAAYEGILQPRRHAFRRCWSTSASSSGARREFARAESLNVAAARLAPGNGTALGNTVEMQLDQGKFKEAAATAARLERVVAGLRRRAPTARLVRARRRRYAARASRQSDACWRRARRKSLGLYDAHIFAMRDGRLRDFSALRNEARWRSSSRPGPTTRSTDVWFDLMVKGPSAAALARLDSAIAQVPFASCRWSTVHISSRRACSRRR